MADSIDPERVVLENWKKERAELDAAIAVLERKIMARSGASISVAGGNGGQIGPDEFFRLSTPDAIKKFLKIVGKPARATTDIVEGLKRGGMNTNYTNVYTALMRLQKKGVVKVGENWGLDEWYPPAPARELKSVIGNLDQPESTTEIEEKTEAVTTDQEAAAENVTPSVQPTGKLSRKDVVAEFIRTHGPSTRAEILAGTGIPEGTFAYCMNDKEMFVKDDDGKWRNVE